MAWHTMFGDGTEIPLSDLSHVRDTIHKNMVCDRWRKGDLLMIDNFRISHGRQVQCMGCIYACMVIAFFNNSLTVVREK